MFIRVEIETGYHTGQAPIVIEVDDDTPEKGLEEIAREEFFNQCSYCWQKCDENGEPL